MAKKKFRKTARGFCGIAIFDFSAYEKKKKISLLGRDGGGGGGGKGKLGIRGDQVGKTSRRDDYIHRRPNTGWCYAKSCQVSQGGFGQIGY